MATAVDVDGEHGRAGFGAPERSRRPGPPRPAPAALPTEVIARAGGPGRRPPSWVIRGLDIAVAGALLIAVAIPMALVGLMVAVSSPGPMFYQQARIGQHGRVFGCVKFRTMVRDAEDILHQVLADDGQLADEYLTTWKLKDDPRVTPIGRFLRSTSLDELPQLFNVLFGDMSLVGPRPITVAELPIYGGLAEVVFQVRPGLTGRWQVSGRNDTTYEERVRLDVDYVQDHSVSTYVATLVRTVPAVVRPQSSGAY